MIERAGSMAAVVLLVAGSAGAEDWTQVREGVPRGQVTAVSVPDRSRGHERKAWVYTPPAHGAAGPALGLLICFDGLAYVEDMPVPTVLDNLRAAGRIAPLIAVMVDNSEDRLGDLANHATFARFMAEDLLPWARAHYRVSREASRVTLCGSSAGGLGAAYVAFRHPELFGNVLAQSGAFWRGDEGGSDPAEWLTAQFQSAPRSGLRFYLEVGARENHATAGGPIFIEANRRLRDVLQAKGYEVRYVEVPGAVHEPGHWRQQLADGLLFLIGPPASP